MNDLQYSHLKNILNVFLC